MIARTTSLLLIMLIAMPAMPVRADCGCTEATQQKSCCQQKSSCEQKPCCSERDESPAGGCNCDSVCQCGHNCQCGRADNDAPVEQPSLPHETTVDDSSGVVGHSTTVVTIASSVPNQTRAGTTVCLLSHTAQQTCVLLSRFVL